MKTESEIREVAENFLSAWNSQDVERVVACYTDDVEYWDPNTRGVVKGADAMRRYLRKLFAAWECTGRSGKRTLSRTRTEPPCYGMRLSASLARRKPWKPTAWISCCCSAASFNATRSISIAWRLPLSCRNRSTLMANWGSSGFRVLRFHIFVLVLVIVIVIEQMRYRQVSTSEDSATCRGELPLPRFRGADASAVH